MASRPAITAMCAPPATDEVWVGGVVCGRGGGGRRQRLIHRVTLTLDGVFFVDGGFAGPNRKHLWEQVVHTADIHIQVANIAREGHREGISPERILAEIESITGPWQDQHPMWGPSGMESSPEAYREAALKRV